MTDEQRKALTLYLGECWHNVQQGACGVFSCVNCGYTPNEIQDNYNRTFDTDADMTTLFRRLVITGDWHSHSNKNSLWKYSYDTWEKTTKEQDYVAWLFYDPERFCCLVAEWWVK